MFVAQARPRPNPTAVPITPIDDPVRKKMRIIEPRVEPMALRMAMSRALSFTSIIMLERTLNAATMMMSVRMRNITFRSTSSALTKLALDWRQSNTCTPGSVARMIRAPTSRTFSGSAIFTSIFVMPSPILKKRCAVSSGM